MILNGFEKSGLYAVEKTPNGNIRKLFVCLSDLPEEAPDLYHGLEMPSEDTESRPPTRRRPRWRQATRERRETTHDICSLSAFFASLDFIGFAETRP